MTKNKFAGLAEAKMKALEAEGQGSEPETESIAVKQESKKAVKQANKSASKLAKKSAPAASTPVPSKPMPVDLVGVTIKVPEDKRIWWNVQAKLQRTTLTDAIIAALDARFGQPKF